MPLEELPLTSKSVAHYCIHILPCTLRNPEQIFIFPSSHLGHLLRLLAL